MKKYIKPVMESEIFVTNEFVSACADQTDLACLNMNDAKKVYKETNGVAGLQTSGENADSVWSAKSWNKMNDCDTDGDATGGNHSYSNIVTTDLLYVTYNESGTNYTPAYYTEDGPSHNPHFISVTTYRNAS